MPIVPVAVILHSLFSAFLCFMAAIAPADNVPKTHIVIVFGASSVSPKPSVNRLFDTISRSCAIEICQKLGMTMFVMVSPITHAVAM